MNNKIDVEKKVPLSGLSTFKIGGDASYFYRLTNKDALSDVILFSKENKLPLFFLGGGSNVLFSDSDFVGGVQYLIKQNIISVPKGHVTSADSEVAIPQWIKTTAGWWANRLISDKDFASGIQYLISRDIIKV